VRPPEPDGNRRRDLFAPDEDGGAIDRGLGRDVPAEARRAHELTRGLYEEMYGGAPDGQG